jgi:hypothetical protein
MHIDEMPSKRLQQIAHTTNLRKQMRCNQVNSITKPDTKPLAMHLLFLIPPIMTTATGA